MTTQQKPAARKAATQQAPAIMSYGKEIILPKDMNPDDFISLDLMEVGERMSLIDFADTYGFDSVAIYTKTQNPSKFENHKYQRLFFITLLSKDIKTVYGDKTPAYSINLMPGTISGNDEDLEKLMIDIKSQLDRKLPSGIKTKLDQVDGIDRISVIKTVNGEGEEVIKLAFSNFHAIH